MITFFEVYKNELEFTLMTLFVKEIFARSPYKTLHPVWHFSILQDFNLDKKVLSQLLQYYVTTPVSKFSSTVNFQRNIENHVLFEISEILNTLEYYLRLIGYLKSYIHFYITIGISIIDVKNQSLDGST